jgi:hypothetical protein
MLTYSTERFTSREKRAILATSQNKIGLVLESTTAKQAFGVLFSDVFCVGSGIRLEGSAVVP